MRQFSTESAKQAWRVSLHGGHSGEFCDHAEGTLREILEAAVQAGYAAFGVSEHAPRNAERFLYTEEKARGWNLAKIQADFERYILTVNALAREFQDRLTVLRGFEAEVVPTADYISQMRGYRERVLPDGSPAFDYMVGSVHYVAEIQIDASVENYQNAIEHCDGLENFAVRYYETVAQMVEALRPEVVGHLDLIKRNLTLAGFTPAALDTPRIHAAAETALEAVRAHGAILDLNTAGWRKGLGEPYPAPELVRQASAMGIPFCIGDDSHCARQVGEGIEAGRDYLLQNGVDTVMILTREDLQGPVVRRIAPLQ